MGYTTEFQGQLNFLRPLTAEEELELMKYCSGDMENTGDHPDWLIPEGWRGGYIQFVITDDKTGIQWDGNEKFYDAEKAANCVLMNMRAKFPDFTLYGHLDAQGEEFDDRWQLRIGEDGIAYKKVVGIPGRCIRCPHCDEKVYADEAKDWS